MREVKDKEVLIIAHQYDILAKFLYHHRSYKELHRNFQSLKGDKSFWVATIDAHLMQCFNFWCMVFGADKNNDTHWKSINLNLEEDKFKQRLLQGVNMNIDEWTKVWKELTDFRNKFTAHRDLGFSKPVPYLDYAYKAVFIYDKWLREEILLSSNGVLNEASLKKFEEEHLDAINNTVKKLLNE